MKYWTKEEEDLLKIEFLSKGLKHCQALFPDKNRSAILHKAHRLGVVRKTDIHRWTEDEIQFLQENYPSKGGIFCKDKLDLPYKTIRNKAKVLGLNREEGSTKKWTKEQEQFLIDNYRNTGPMGCSKFIPFSIKAIQGKARKLNLAVSEDVKKKHSSINNYHRNISPLDESVFININLPEVAYILGFIWADGTVNMNYVDFCIVEDDFKDIENILTKTGKWSYYKRTRKNRRPSKGFKSSNKILCQFLCSVGYKDKSKVDPNNILKFIPQKLMKYWWRGYFDGDGCFYVNKDNNCYQMSIAGSYNQEWDSIELLLKSLSITYRIVRRKQKLKNGKISKSSSVRVIGIQNISKFGNFIYDQYDNIGLKRKRNKYLQVF